MKPRAKQMPVLQPVEPQRETGSAAFDSDNDGSSDGDKGTLDRSKRCGCLPSDGTQWADSDGDGYGDNPSGTNGDACPTTVGNLDR